jgi:hypothetical protein
MDISAAEFIIGKFGGLTGTAKAVRKPVTTVQGWKDRGSIPQQHWRKLIAAAKERGEILDLEDFLKRHVAEPAKSSAAA